MGLYAVRRISWLQANRLQLIFSKCPDLAQDFPTQLVVIRLLIASQSNFAQVVNIRHYSANKTRHGFLSIYTSSSIPKYFEYGDGHKQSSDPHKELMAFSSAGEQQPVGGGTSE